MVELFCDIVAFLETSPSRDVITAKKLMKIASNIVGERSGCLQDFLKDAKLWKDLEFWKEIFYGIKKGKNGSK
jgi:hypothetical protein